MKGLLPFSLICLIIISFSSVRAQDNDTTYSNRSGVIDSLKLELKKIETAYRLFKERADSTHEVSDLDREELKKLSDSLERIGEEIREYSENVARLANDAARIYDVENAVIENGDYTLEDDVVFDRDLKILNGDAFIYGTINGSLIVVDGDAYVRRGAKVTGNVVVVNGKAHISKDAAVEGNIIERSGSDLEERHSLVDRLRLTEHPDIWQNRSFLFEKVAANYNRVDGLFLGLGQDKDYFWSAADDFSPYGFVGYAFKLHRWRYQLGLDKWFGNENRFELGVEGHSLTDSKDYWIIGPKENSAYSILAREDFMDYFSRDGASFHVAQYYQMNSRITLSYDVDKYSSLSQHTNWSIFGGDKSFRPNPAITDGWMRSIVVDIEHRSYGGGDRRRQGWMTDLHDETTVSGGFDFRMLSADVVRYQPLFSGLQLNMRLRAGTSSGVLPLQRLYQIGGFNTLNAYQYKEFSGNRLLLFNFEFLFSPDLFRRSDFFPFNTFTLILFGDAGQLKDAGPSAGLTESWGVMRAADFKSDYGIGIGSGDGAFRIYLAWRTDRATSPTFGVRLDRPF